MSNFAFNQSRANQYQITQQPELFEANQSSYQPPINVSYITSQPPTDDIDSAYDRRRRDSSAKHELTTDCCDCLDQCCCCICFCWTQSDEQNCCDCTCCDCNDCDCGSCDCDSCDCGNCDCSECNN